MTEYELEDNMYDAMSKGNLTTVISLFEKGIRPSQSRIDYAAGQGHFNIIQWLAEPERGILPTRTGASAAQIHSQFLSQTPGNEVQIQNQQKVLSFLAQKGIFPRLMGDKGVKYVRKLDVHGKEYLDLYVY